MRFRSTDRIRKGFQNSQLATGARNRAQARHTWLQKARHEASKHLRVHLTPVAFHRLRRSPPRSPHMSCETRVQLVNGMREEHPENPATSLEKKKPAAVEIPSQLSLPLCATSRERQ